MSKQIAGRKLIEQAIERTKKEIADFWGTTGTRPRDLASRVYVKQGEYQYTSQFQPVDISELIKDAEGRLEVLQKRLRGE